MHNKVTNLFPEKFLAGKLCKESLQGIIVFNKLSTGQQKLFCFEVKNKKRKKAKQKNQQKSGKWSNTSSQQENWAGQGHRLVFSVLFIYLEVCGSKAFYQHQLVSFLQKSENIQLWKVKSIQISKYSLDIK